MHGCRYPSEIGTTVYCTYTYVPPTGSVAKKEKEKALSLCSLHTCMEGVDGELGVAKEEKEKSPFLCRYIHTRTEGADELGGGGSAYSPRSHGIISTCVRTESSAAGNTTEASSTPAAYALCSGVYRGSCGVRYSRRRGRTHSTDPLYVSTLSTCLPVSLTYAPGIRREGGELAERDPIPLHGGTDYVGDERGVSVGVI